MSGTLGEDLELDELARFLTSTGLSGLLTIEDPPFSGQLYLAEHGLAGAGFANETGRPALEAIALGLGKGRFAFSSGAADSLSNLRLTGAELVAQLEALAEDSSRFARVVPSLAAVPRQAIADTDEADGTVSLSREALRLLLTCTGRASVADLAERYGLLATLKQLAQLVELELIEFELAQRGGAWPATARAVPEATASARAR